ncbi:aryl-sulfate sulfotransferase [Brachyspira innocens]|uniref:Aryl-sulfate sulfotransferase n=1 Tax=Brachyspira innocens TaxID=13264 RepID=A0ABT8YU36_9SPIR|nr:aryl-sulfate sulfotransferase [Brachyspira innocens]MDO6993603.1 aryl-sulfate sulfotransferase [Brachyspira innocens]MDO7019296.1 aryl-sulfate sulfotransferase [Brachyspira innocens]
MKKILTIIILLFTAAISCNKNNNTTGSIGKVGEITINPLKNTPLSAVYITETVNSNPITVTVKGQHGEADLVHTYPAGYGTEFPIHGMYPNIENTITVNDGGRIIEQKHNPGTITMYRGYQLKERYEPVKAYDSSVKENYPNNPDMFFVGVLASQTDATAWEGLIAVSKNGYVRYVNTAINYISRFAVDNNRFILYNMEGNEGIYDFFGQRILTTKNHMHHELVKKGDNYIYLANSDLGWEDSLIEMDASGNIVNELYFGDVLRKAVGTANESELSKIVFDYKTPYNGNTKIDWFHANACVYDSSSDILYVSSRHRGVLAIKYTSWELLWWMADDTLKVDTGTAYSQIPYDVQFKDVTSLAKYRVGGAAVNDGPRNQHALLLYQNGKIAMFDNRDEGGLPPNMTVGESRYVEYQITQDSSGNWTALKTDEYKNGEYSKMVSDIDLTGDNNENLLITYGSFQAKIFELNKTSKAVLYQLNLPFLTYRTEKMPLYYEQGRKYPEDSNLKQPLIQ